MLLFYISAFFVALVLLILSLKNFGSTKTQRRGPYFQNCDLTQKEAERLSDVVGTLLTSPVHPDNSSNRTTKYKETAQIASNFFAKGYLVVDTITALRAPKC
jgi:hypothetical protein